jgi:hypothetical protein
MQRFLSRLRFLEALGPCLNTILVIVGSPHGLTLSGGGLVAGLATPGGQICTLYGPPGRPGGLGAGGWLKLRRTDKTF